MKKLFLILLKLLYLGLLVFWFDWIIKWIFIDRFICVDGCVWDRSIDVLPFLLPLILFLGVALIDNERISLKVFYSFERRYLLPFTFIFLVIYAYNGTVFWENLLNIEFWSSYSYVFELPDWIMISYLLLPLTMIYFCVVNLANTYKIWTPRKQLAGYRFFRLHSTILLTIIIPFILFSLVGMPLFREGLGPFIENFTGPAPPNY